MTVETIDTMQTQQIEDLQDDIEDLAAKVNLAVTDVNQLTTKLNTVITDISNLVAVLMGSTSGNQYTPGTPISTDGLLKRVDELFSIFWDHIHMPPFSQTGQGFVSSHPPYIPGSWAIYPAHATPLPDSLAAVSQVSPAVTGYDQNSSPAFPAGGRAAVAVTGSYTPEPTKSAIVLKKNPENRARQMTRKNLNTVRG
jgi:hypothetical protein